MQNIIIHCFSLSYIKFPGKESSSGLRKVKERLIKKMHYKMLNN